MYTCLLTSFCVFQLKETFLQRACERWLELFLVTELSFHIKLKDLPFDLLLKTLRSPRSHTFSYVLDLFKSFTDTSYWETLASLSCLIALLLHKDYEAYRTIRIFCTVTFSSQSLITAKHQDVLLLSLFVIIFILSIYISIKQMHCTKYIYIYTLCAELIGKLIF